jgi:hypothetical protein
VRVEVRMSSRRSYQRYGLNNASGYLRLVRDVTLWRGVESEYVVISDEPEAAGELVTIEHAVNGTVVSAEVCVIDGHPTIVNGIVRHRLRLRSDEGIGTQRNSRRSSH